MKETRSYRSALAVTAAALLSLSLAPGLKAQANGDLLVRVQAQGSVSQVAGRLKQAVSQNGLMVMGQLNQGKILGMTGAKVESQSFFLGNPQLGKKLFAADEGVGVAVPVRINVYRDGQGHTVISYFKPSEELKAFGSPVLDKMAPMLDQKLHAIASAAATS